MLDIRIEVMWACAPCITYQKTIETLPIKYLKSSIQLKVIICINNIFSIRADKSPAGFNLLFFLDSYEVEYEKTSA